MKLIFSKAYLIKIRNKSSGESWRLATIEDLPPGTVPYLSHVLAKIDCALLFFGRGQANHFAKAIVEIDDHNNITSMPTIETMIETIEFHKFEEDDNWREHIPA